MPQTPNTLPAGQYALADFPRFGLLQYVDRFPKSFDIELQILGDVTTPVTISSELAALPRVEQTSDFHCVTTWSHRSLRWSGYRFSDVFAEIVTPLARPKDNLAIAVLRCQDGYRTSLTMDDIMAGDVLLADQLNGQPLPLEHGAPLRLVAPAHYGYKNTKHVSRIEFWCDADKFRPPGNRLTHFLDHPRARVAHEERGRYFPGWLLRHLYRPLVGSVIKKYARATKEYRQRTRTKTPA